MYLMTLVNSTLVGRRPSGHVELVDLSVEKKKAQERYKEQNGNLSRYGSRSTAEADNLKPTASPRSRRAPADQPATDLLMEPLIPLFLGSPSSDSSDADAALRAQELLMQKIRDTETLPCSLEDTSMTAVEKTFETVSPRQEEPDQELPRIIDKQSDMKQGEQTVAETVIDGSKTIKPTKTRVTPKLGGLFSDGGVSTRVQRHPLEMIAEQELDIDCDSSPRTKENAAMTTKNFAEKGVREKIDLSARVLQHPLARIDESPVKERPVTERPMQERPVRERPVKESQVKENPVKERKPPIRKLERKNVAVPAPQPVRKVIRNAKPEVKEPQKRERPKLRDGRAPITKPRLGSEVKRPDAKRPEAKRPEAKRPEVNDQEKPSLANPVLEKMPRLASPEPPYAWNKKFQNLPKLALSSVDTEPMVEERELRYSSPKMTESDAQDDLSFRVWERGTKPKRKTISVSRDFQDSLDLESSQDLEEHPQLKDKRITPAQSSPSPGKEKSMENVTVNLPPVSTLDLRRKRATPNVEVDTRNCEEEMQHGYPSPSSVSCGLSPTSLFSDDDNIFSRSQQFPNFNPSEGTTIFCKSPQSVLSQEPNEISHFASDNSVEIHHHQRASSSSMYNDESSDLESPKNGAKNHEETELNRGSFRTFTYTDQEMGQTSSDEDDHGAEFSDLWYFQEAGNREPWLEKDGGVLDDTDLEFLLPPDFKDHNTLHEESVSEISEVESPGRSQNSQNTWVPYVTGTNSSPTRSPARGRHSRSSSFSKNQEKLPPRPPKRSVKFAPDLVREMSASTPRKPIQLPRPESSPVKDEDDQIFPSVKSWEVEEEEDTSTTSTPRRRWRRSPSPKPSNPNPTYDQVDTEPDSGASIMASRRPWRRQGNLDDSPTSSRRHRVAQILPCAGRLLSAFKVSRRRHLESDDDSRIGTGSTSFGRSARRDAQQVRRILKGSQKKNANLTVADLLDDNFAS